MVGLYVRLDDVNTGNNTGNTGDFDPNNPENSQWKPPPKICSALHVAIQEKVDLDLLLFILHQTTVKLNPNVGDGDSVVRVTIKSRFVKRVFTVVNFANYSTTSRCL